MVQLHNQRVAYGETLVALGRENPDIVVLEADLGKSTQGIMFQKEYPDRFYEMSIAEANMAGVAAGLSLTGKIPFMASFAVFSTGRCYDQIRTSICIPALNVKICGSSAGLSDAGDGSTHQSVDDLALMRVLPNMQVFSPADAIEVKKILRYMAENEGPMYIRVSRGDLPDCTNPDDKFIPGKVYPLRQGKDAVVFATGVMVSRALEAADALEREGCSVMVVNVPSLKPIDSDAVLSICKDFDAVVTAEEHSVIGGLGAAIASILAERQPKKVKMIGIQDKFGTSGQDYETLLEAYGLTAKAIMDAVRAC
ncbi:MAG: transketolase family protein [Acetivibrionales bacterium]|jgi:transketolase